MKTKKLLSVILCLAFVLGITNISVFAEGEPKTAEIFLAAQADGGFLTAPGITTVSENAAENYGFTDGVDGVSVLDALVKAHEIRFGENFTSETAGSYITAGGGYISTVFGIETSAFGFMLNGGTPNDGTGNGTDGYNGTTAATQKVVDGDKLDFFIYRDATAFTDVYTWIDGELSAAPGSDIKITVSARTAMNGYLYETPADFKASALPAKGVSLAWIGENGALKEIDGAVTDDEGSITVTLPADFALGDYYLTAVGADASGSPVIMNPAKITAAEKADIVSVMHNIAKKYSESGIASDLNAPWFAADLAEYLYLYPDTENRLSDEQIQEFLDVIIPAADSATAPGDLAKYIISLRALGFDPTKVITSDSRTVNIPGKLKTLIEENDTSVTNIFSLPYVIIAMSQGEGYIEQSYIDNFINTIIAGKKKWQKNALGTDAATPILLALAPYYDTNSEVKTVIDETVELLKKAQTDIGLIGNAASTGLALTAFSALGIDGSEVKKETSSLTDGLMTQATDSLDGFLPVLNSFGTEQGFRGLIAWRFLSENAERSFYDFSKNPLNTAKDSWASCCPVTFSVVPEGAAVTVEGQTPVSENVYDLPEGEYKYSASEDSYQTFEGSFTVSAEEASKHTPKKINVSLSGKPSSGSGKITVNLKILTHDAKECNGEYTYKKNASAYKTLLSGSVSLNEGQTVFDAFDMLLKEKKTDYVEKTYGYISSIDGLEEFDHGPNSGWLFMVDGVASQKSCRDYTLNKSSSVTWFYTDDYTSEKGSEPWTKSSGSGSTSGYTVKLLTADGKTFKSLTVQNGKSVELPEPEARDGYTFDGWFLDKEFKTKFDPSADLKSNITLYPKWIPDEDKDEEVGENEEIFGDVSEDAWYYDAVKYVLEKGLMQGTGKGFEPDAEMTRAMLITVLYRAEADGKEYTSCPFEDVKTDDWYFNAVAWGFEKGLVSGTDEKTFSPNVEITREQTALILFRFAKMKGYPTDEYSDLSDFNDTALISDWALDAFKWANAAGIINGIGNGLISPKTYTTRAQMAALLMRFFENYEK